MPSNQKCTSSANKAAGMKLHALVKVWVMAVALRGNRRECQRKSQRTFHPDHLSLDFGAAEPVESLKLACDGVATSSHLIETYCLKQYGRRENMGCLKSKPKTHMNS